MAKRLQGAPSWVGGSRGKREAGAVGVDPSRHLFDDHFGATFLPNRNRSTLNDDRGEFGRRGGLGVGNPKSREEPALLIKDKDVFGLIERNAAREESSLKQGAEREVGGDPGSLGERSLTGGAAIHQLQTDDARGLAVQPPGLNLNLATGEFLDLRDQNEGDYPLSNRNG